MYSDTLRDLTKWKFPMVSRSFHIKIVIERENLCNQNTISNTPKQWYFSGEKFFYVKQNSV